jgi:hypothetical protein
MILKVSVGILINVAIVEKNLAIFHPGKRVTDLAFAGAKGFDFCSMQDNAGLERFYDEIVAPGFRIGEDVGHARAASR